MYNIKILWLIGLYLGLIFDLVFQYTLVQVKVLVYYLDLEYNFYHTFSENVHLSEDVNNLWAISDFCENNVLFPYLS